MLEEFSIDRRRCMAAIGMAGLSLVGARSLAASPTVRRMYVGFPPGGTADGIARALSQALATSSDTYVVENKSGASGRLAADALRAGSSDSLDLLVAPSSTLTLLPNLYKVPPFDPRKDFSPVAGLCDHAFGLAVGATSQFQNIRSLLEWIKTHSEEAAYASPGTGTAPHFLGITLGNDLGIQLTHVPFRGVMPGLQDVIGGRVPFTFNPLPSLLEQHRGGRIRILAVTSPERLPSLPNVPTMAQCGHPNLELVEWYGTFARWDTLTDALSSVSKAIHASLQGSILRQAMAKFEVTPRFETPQSLKAMVDSDFGRWRARALQAGITVD